MRGKDLIGNHNTILYSKIFLARFDNTAGLILLLYLLQCYIIENVNCGWRVTE